jgi:hypothetical protein
MVPKLPAVVAARIFLLMLLASLPLFVAPAPAQSETSSEPVARVSVQPQEAGRRIRPDFLGFSYEAPAVAGGYFDVRNHELIRLLSNLGGGTLRFGGNSVEFTGWRRGREAKMAGERAVVTPADLNRLFAFSAKTGWRVILGLNLGHFDPKLFADEAAYAVRHGGRQLLGLEIGNEPDLFMHNGLRPQSWGYADFHREFDAYLKAIRARAPQAPISGPATCCAAGWRWFPRFVADEHSELVFASHHIYPMSAAPGIPANSPHYASIANMLSPELMSRVAQEARQLARVASARRLPLRIAETNSASHGGKNGVSNVFAAALWGVDYAFTLAEQGASGLNFHGGFVCRGYTAICRSGGHYAAQPLYYGMLLFHAATPGRIVPVRVRASANIAAHAVFGDDGKLSLVLINKDAARSVEARISGAGSYTRAIVLRLEAPSLEAQTGITFGGEAVRADGNWTDGGGETIRRQGRIFQVSLPAASALLARFEK